MSYDKNSPVSRIPRLFEKSLEERRRLVEMTVGLPDGALDALDSTLSTELCETLVENGLGSIGIPLGVATNFTIDNRDVLVPMAIEEPSVIAAASNAAKMARAGGGFTTEADPPITTAQIELRDVSDIEGAMAAIQDAELEIAETCNRLDQRLVQLGGGFDSIELRPLTDRLTLVVHLHVDCRDAMGANTVNTMAEALGGRLAELASGRLGMRILTNLAVRRKVRARCRIPAEALARSGWPGTAVLDGIVEAGRFAELDPYRAATHNKGIMNGIDAVLVATGNDWRAVEAGAHAYAAISGQYSPLSRWERAGDNLDGKIELPLTVGTIGGTTKVHPIARLALQILGEPNAIELARIVAAAGLAQNLAAMAAMAAEGIQAGHMALHKRAR